VTIAGTNLQATNARVCASAYHGDGSNLTNVGISGNISVNNATVGGNLHVGGTVTAVGAAIFNSTVTVSGNATFKTNVSVSGNTNLGGTVTVAGAVSLASTLSVGGAANFGSTVTVAGAVSLASTLSVGGATNLASTVTVVGAGTFKDDVSVSGNTNLGGTVTVGGAVSLASTLSVGGATNLLSTVTAAGNAGFLGTVRVSGNTSLEGQLQLTESAAAAVHTTAINGVTSVSLNFGIAQNFFTSVTAAHTLARPTNARVGQVGSILLMQDGGSGTMSYNACFNFIGGTAPTLSTDDNAMDRLDYIVVSVSSDNTAENIQAVMTQAYS
jgi:predicted acyltransferase (DUF342 family)